MVAIVMAEVRGEGIKIVNKKVRSDKKYRVQSFLTKDFDDRLNRVSRACNQSESRIVADILEYMLDNPQFLIWIQDKYKVSKDDPFRIIPQTVNGKLQY
jgi:hypothetical protein